MEVEMSKHKTREELDCWNSNRKGTKFEGVATSKNEKMDEDKNEKKKNEEGFVNKEQLKNKEEMQKYLNNNSSGIMEKFELINYIDSGGESHVYGINIKTEDKNGKIHRKKAILKAIVKHKRENDNKRQIFISNKLKNKNIIDLYGFTKLKDQTYLLFMENAKYGHLRNFERKIIKRPNLSESMLCFFANQILTAIAYCHKCKVAHLDIKPQNIVIDEYLNAKLIDFSISLNYEGKKNNDPIVLPCRGTNFYLAKEVLESKKIKIKDLNKVDLYSFGVVLYNLAFSRYPHNLTHGDEDNYEEILRKIKNNKIEFDRGYSPYFIDFLNQLLKRDINERIDINGALNHYWIKGAQLLLEEKEKICNASIFTSYLMTDYIPSFNDYIDKHKHQKIIEKIPYQENICVEKRQKFNKNKENPLKMCR